MLRTTRRTVAVLFAVALAAAACSSNGEADAASSAASDEASSSEAVDTEQDADSGSAQSIPAADLVAPGEQFAPIEIVGASLEPMPPQIPVTEADNDPAVGVVAPDVSGTDFSGAPVTITADGTPRVVMFVAHWCPHCQREIPAVKQLIDSGAVPEGLEIVVVSTAVREGDPNFPPQDWLEDEQWPGPILRDSPEFEALFAFGAGGFPFSVYLDSEHRVVARSAGELPADILQQIWLATANA